MNSSGTAGSIAAYGKIAMSGRQLKHQVTSIRASLEGTGCKLWCFYGDYICGETGGHHPRWTWS